MTIPAPDTVTADARRARGLAEKAAELYLHLHASGYHRDTAQERSRGGAGGGTTNWATQDLVDTRRQVRSKLANAAEDVAAAGARLEHALAELREVATIVDAGAGYSPELPRYPLEVSKVELAELAHAQARRDASNALAGLARARAALGKARSASKPKGKKGRAA